MELAIPSIVFGCEWNRWSSSHHWRQTHPMIQKIANSDDDMFLAQWFRQVKRIYGKKRRKLLVGLCADLRLCGRHIRGQPLDQPFKILQLCIDSRCLIYDLPKIRKSGNYYRNDFKITCALKSFLRDPRVEFVGIGIHGVVEKLEKDFGLKVGKAVDLHELVMESLCRNDLDRRCLERLAKIVFGEDMDIIKPGYLEWNHPDYYGILSDDKVKFATVDAFPCYAIGDKCKKIIKDNTSDKDHAAAASSS